MRTENEYYRVTAPFRLLIRDGVAPAQVYIGRSQVMQQLWREQDAQPGDEIHLLHGGNFLISDGNSFEFDFHRHTASEILLHPAPRRSEELPANKVQSISPEEANSPKRYRA